MSPLRCGSEMTVVIPRLQLYQFFPFLGAKRCPRTPRVAVVEFDDVHQSFVPVWFCSSVPEIQPRPDQEFKGSLKKCRRHCTHEDSVHKQF